MQKKVLDILALDEQKTIALYKFDYNIKKYSVLMNLLNEVYKQIVI